MSHTRHRRPRREQCHESFKQNFYFPIVTTFCLSITTISVCSMNFLSLYSLYFIHNAYTSWLNFICSLIFFFFFSSSLNKGRRFYILLIFFFCIYFFIFFFPTIPIIELNNITFLPLLTLLCHKLLLDSFYIYFFPISNQILYKEIDKRKAKMACELYDKRHMC